MTAATTQRTSASEPPRAALKRLFGFDGFRPGQADIVDRVMKRQNVLAVMPTGAGKSLCYQLPAALSEGVTIVISPLIALMDNQLAQLNTLGLAAGAVHSNRPREQSVADWRRVQEGACKLFYMAPERLMTERMITALKDVPVARFVVDEAHCVSQWGHDFRPDYLALSEIRTHFPNTPVAAFTATADERTRGEIVERLLGRDAHVTVHGFDRPNIDIAVEEKTDAKKQILSLIDEHKDEQGIVYCLSRKETEDIADHINAHGRRAAAYHAGLPPEERTARLNAFLTEPDLIIVATVAFGMGIDKPDIRFVFHYTLPSSMEAYYQELGRAGRDGAPARAVLLYGAGDGARRRRLINMNSENENNTAGRADHARLDDLIGYCEGVQCRRAALLAYFGETLKECAGCDICRNPPQMQPAASEARLVLQAVEESGQMFGPAFIIDILRGADTEKVRQKNANLFASYAKGKDHTGQSWRAVIRQMISADLLEADHEYGGLRLGQAAQDVGAIKDFAIRQQTTKRATRQRAEKALPKGASEALYQALKAHRLALAQERNVPAYVIFTDRSLMDMALKKPTNERDFGQVFGVGAAKVRDFAESFLPVIAAHRD